MPLLADKVEVGINIPRGGGVPCSDIDRNAAGGVDPFGDSGDSQRILCGEIDAGKSTK